MRASTLALACIAAILLAGCGKKPSDVDAPTGSDTRLFPRSYPSADRDPLLRDPPARPGERTRS